MSPAATMIAGAAPSDADADADGAAEPVGV